MGLNIHVIMFLVMTAVQSCSFTLVENDNNSTQSIFINGTYASSCNSQSPSPRDIGIGGFLILVIIIAVFGNIIVIIGILYSPSLRSQVTNYFLISLAVSDILIPLFILPFRIMMIFSNGAFCASDNACKIILILSTCFDTASITNILAVSIDRFIAINFSLKYTSIMSERRALEIIGTIWLYSALWAGLGVFDWENPQNITVKLHGGNQCFNANTYYYVAVFSAVFIIPLIIIGLMYLVILKMALKHARAIGALEIKDEQRERKTAKRRRMKNFRSMKSISMVYGAFAVCWLPNCIISIHSSLNRGWWVSFRMENPGLFAVVYNLFVLILPPLNCTLNPFIYSLLHKNFRAAFMFTLYRIIGKQRSRRMTETSYRQSNEGIRNRGISGSEQETQGKYAEHKF